MKEKAEPVQASCLLPNQIYLFIFYLFFSLWTHKLTGSEKLQDNL